MTTTEHVLAFLIAIAINVALAFWFARRRAKYETLKAYDDGVLVGSDVEIQRARSIAKHYGAKQTLSAIECGGNAPTRKKRIKE